MAVPKAPRPASNNDDAGFPPLRESGDEANAEEDEAEDFESDFHEEGGGD